MIKTKLLYDFLTNIGVDYYAGVPDSLLKDICSYITDNTPPERNIIAANEGGAVGLAIGYHLATGRVPLVYMQNSGFGNIINPLLSLADSDVYSIPMLCLIGWRGEPGRKDEPQHVKQGRVNEAIMESIEMPYCILSDDLDKAKEQIKQSLQTAVDGNKPVGILIRKGTFESYSLLSQTTTSYELNREGAVKVIVDSLNNSDIVVSTTGKTSREVYEHREAIGQGHEKDFLTVGGMGHASQIALGIAQQKEDRNVYCLDGDGAAIMHLGALPLIGTMNVSKYKHILINNGAHDSVGGQPTVGFEIDFTKLAMASGYKYAVSVEKTEDLRNELAKIRTLDQPCLIEVKVNKGARKDLGRPKTTPKENKTAFMSFICNK